MFRVNFIKVLLIFLLQSIFCTGLIWAQTTHTLSLQQTIDIAKKSSPDALLTKTKYRQSYWQYLYYKADYLPALSLDATLPDLNRSYSRITLPDGEDAFVYRSLSNSSVNLALSQKIGLTGGTIFGSSGLQRIDILSDKRTSYLSTPVSIGFNQPLFGFNNLKWQNRVEPLYFREAKRQYVQDMEDISLRTSALFFDVLTAQADMSISLINRQNNDTLYKLAQGRYNLGKIAENDLLQLELNYLNAGLNVEQAKLRFVGAAAKLKSFLGFNAQDSLILLLPGLPDSFNVNIPLAWQQARQNNPLTLSLERRLIEAERDVARARGENGFQGNLFAEFGLNKSTPFLEDIYVNPQDQERLRFGIQVPILDWGKTRGAIEMAKARQLLAETNLRKEQTDFEQEVSLQAAEFNLQRSQLTIALKASDVGKRRYFIAKQRYLLGKIDITDLNIAQTEGDAAQKNYIQVLGNAWGAYYRLRRTTLYDFGKNAPLEVDLENLD